MSSRVRYAVAGSAFAPPTRHRAAPVRRALSGALALLLSFASPLGSAAASVSTQGAPGEPARSAPAALSSIGIDRVTAQNLRAVTFVDASLGFAVGTGSTILKTTDGGFSWTVVNSGGSYDLQGVSFYNANRGLAVSLTGVVLETDNGGASWMLGNEDLAGELYAVEQLRDIEYVTETEGVAVGGAQDTPPMVWRSYAGGTGWTTELWGGTYQPPAEMPPFPLMGLGEFQAVDFPTTGRGWAVGTDNYTNILSTDPLYPQPAPPRSVIFDYDSSRGGQKWVLQNISGSGTLYDVSFSDTSNGVAVGAGGKVQYTSDGGTTWNAGTSGTTSNLLGVAMAGGGLGWAVGAGGLIRKTTDGGATWSSVSSPVGNNLQSVTSLGGTKAVAVGDSGAIVMTLDGATWFEPPDPPQVTSLFSPTHPAGTWVATTTVGWAWTATPEATVDGYSFAFDQVSNTVPATTVSTTAKSATTTATASGAWYAHVRAHDVAGRWSSTVHAAALVDVTRPTANDDAVASYLGGASIEITATDAHSGVASISYKLDDAATWTTVSAATANVSTSALGAHTLEYFATDKVGNRSASRTVEFTVTDATPPGISSDAVASYMDHATITLTATDNEALASISYKLDSEATVTVTASGTTDEAEVNISAFGDHTLAFWATDAAGNESAHSTVGFRVVDSTAPDTTPPVVFTDAVASYGGIAEIEIWATDADSGVASVSYKLDSAASYTTVAGDSATVSTTAKGAHQLRYYATDGVGNASAPALVAFSVAGTPPIATNDLYTTPEDNAISWSAANGVLRNDIDFDAGDVLAVEDWTEPGHGTLALAADGSFTYTPDADFNGVDTFTYTATDGTLLSDAATVSITVGAANDNPTFTPGGVVTVAQDSGAYSRPWATAISAGPADEQGQTLSFEASVDVPSLFASQPSIAGDGTLSFTPAAGESGTAFVLVTLTDDDTAGGPALSTEATLTITITPSEGPPPVELPDGLVRVAGTDRYSTAVEASKRAYPDGADTVVIATGANWPDALGGSALAGAADGPLLLTLPTALPASVSDEIRRLGAQHAYVLGGTGAVSLEVEAQLRAMLGAGGVTRLAGADRYATARAVADEVIGLAGAGYDGGAIVATGGNYPDALAGSPIAAAKTWPILLAHPATGSLYLPSAASHVAILGGTGAVSGAVESALVSSLGSGHVVRLGGLNRYATAALVAQFGVDSGLHWDGVGVATGENFPDALSAGAMLGFFDTVMLLTQSSVLSPDAAAALSANAAAIDTTFIVGGTGAVSAEVAARIEALAGL